MESEYQLSWIAFPSSRRFAPGLRERNGPLGLKRPVFLLLCLGLFASAQTSGTITGTVTDPKHLPIAGAKVVIVHPLSGERREALTNDAGRYAFSFLPPGSYSVRFSFPGFSTAVENATLNVTERIAIDVSLRISPASEKLEVISPTTQLQTETAAVGYVVDSAAIRQLPLAARNFTQLLSLSAGTSATLNDAGSLGRGTQIISSSGARTTSNAITIDGVDALNIHTNSASDNGVGSNGIVTPSPDAIQEFKVQTGLYDTRSGRSGGANVVLVTKSGTNDLHGSAFEFLRNTALNANDFFLNATGSPRQVLNQNQYGGTLGGPLRRNKAFFFLSYQGTRQVNGLAGSTSLRLPSIPLDRSRMSLGKAFAGQTGSRGGPSIAPDGSNINPVALALLNLKLPDGTYLIPSPQITGSGVNYTRSVPSTFDEDQGIINLDYQFTGKNHLAFRGTVAAQPTYKSFTNAGANVPGFGSTQDFKSRLANLVDTHVFSGSVVNEAHFGVSRVLGVVIPQSIVTLSSIGMSRFNSKDYSDIPMITVSGAFSVGYDVNGDQGVTPTTWHFGDTISLNRGRHNLRGGIEGRRYDDNYYSRNRYRGALTIPTMADFLLGLAGTPVARGGNGTGFSNINTAEVASGIPDGADRITDIGLFVQDDWKVSSHLTLNLGLRWDYLGWPVDVFGRRGNFDYRMYKAPPVGGQTSSGFVQSSTARHPLPGLPLVDPALVSNSPTRNFAPRFGFAYRMAKNLVVRGGYGIYYDRLSNQLGLLTSQSAPNYLRTSLTGTGNIASTLQNPFPVLPQQSEYPVLPVLYAPPYTNDRPAIGLNAVDPNLRTPYVQQWGLNLQYQFSRGLMMEAGYMGSKGVALPDRRAINQALLASPEAPINGITTNTAANTPLRVPYPGFSPAGLLVAETAADSHYHSLQISLTKRFGHGLQYSASYTFSKSIDNNSGGSTTVFSEVTGDEAHIWTNKGLSDFDRTHRFVANFIYEIPKWGGNIGRSPIGSYLFNGWAVAGIIIAQSGTPFSITDSTGATFFGTTESRANWAPGATRATALLSGPVESRLEEYFNTAAFTRAGNLFGNSGRNILRGPNQRNFDLSVTKAIPVAERLRAELRGEFFNAFNLVNFSNPRGNVSSSSFGIITDTVGNPRVVQVALKLYF